jgi:hypothetical protein
MGLPLSVYEIIDVDIKITDGLSAFNRTSVPKTNKRIFLSAPRSL